MVDCGTMNNQIFSHLSTTFPENSLLREHLVTQNVLSRFMLIATKTQSIVFRVFN